MDKASIVSIVFLVGIPAARAYFQLEQPGPCRGPGGVLDKVNNRYAGEIPLDDCLQYCEAEPNCNGFSHSPAINEGECVLHGPGLDGTCSDSQYESYTTCVAADEVWTPPPAPWLGESWHSKVVVGTTEETSSSYDCWELDDEDHLAQCEGSGCSFSDTARTAENCPSGCTFVPEPEMPPAKPPHPGDIGLPGWPKPLSGACRGGVNGTDKVNGLYASKDSQTQQNCADKCLSLPTCTGYHHGPYCSVFGPEVHLAADDVVWFATTANDTIVTGTKVNPSYICFTSVPDQPSSGDGAGGDGDGGDGDGGEGDGGDGDGGDGDGGDGDGGDGDGGEGDGGDGDGGDGSGGDGNGGGGDFVLCFSGSSMVKLEDETRIRMRDLKIGDRVQVTEDGKFDTVYSFGHYEPDSVSEYLSIQSTAKAAPITISAPHMLFLDSRKAVPASSIRVGDVLLGGNTVTKIDKVSLLGAYAPFTHSGSIVVDEVVASNYVSLTGTSTFLGIDMQFIAHTAVGARRALCQLNLCEERYSNEGIATWIPYHTAAWIATQEASIGFLTLAAGAIIFSRRRHQKAAL